MCYWRTVVCSNHVMNVIYKNEPRDHLVSPTKKKERERAQNGNHGHRRSWPLESPMPRPHVSRLNKFIRHILGDAVCDWFGRK